MYKQIHQHQSVDASDESGDNAVGFNLKTIPHQDLTTSSSDQQPCQHSETGAGQQSRYPLAMAKAHF